MPSRPTPRAFFLIVLGLFLVSGGTSLVYEVAWARRLTLVFGSGLFATSTILSTFMGGLALGAWWLGRSADRRSNPLVLYGYLELAIGLYALCVPLLQLGLVPLYQATYQASGGAWAVVQLTRVVLCAAVFVLPTVMMGGTLPILSRLVTREHQELGARIGTLYAINTLGAVGGCLLAGFLLIEWLGVTGAERLTAVTNLAVGGVAIWLGKTLPAASAPAEQASEVEAEATATDPSLRTLVVVVYGVSGFTALAYEVIWARTLVFFLGNSTYAFATMLGSFLFGLAAGALVAARFVQRLRNPLAAFALLEWLIGLSMALALVIYPFSAQIQASLGALIPGETWAELVFLRFLIGAMILLVPALLFGAAFPVASRLYVSTRERVGAEVGALYASNTVGAILGSLVAGFVLVPYLGFRHAVVLVVALNASLAWVLSARTPRHLPGALAAIALALGAALLSPSEVFRPTIQRAYPNEEILYYGEFPSTTVFVTQSRDGERWMHFGDQRGSGGTANLPGHRSWGHLPALLSEKRESALVICFGSGITLGSVATHPFERIVCAEICEGIREPAALFPENHGVLDDPRVELVSDDGRNVLLGRSDTYDIIVNEPPLLETAGVVNLFTREFYELVASRLEPGGVFCQWVPSFEFSPEEHALLIRTFLEVFPHATFWAPRSTATRC